MYTFKSRVRYSEIDKNGKLSLEALLNYFQDCSTFQSEDLGLGFTYLKQINQVWLMSAWQIVVDRYPDLCENIIIGTFPYDFRGFMGFRNFFMETEAGERLASANSIWTLYHMEKKRPVKPLPEMLSGYILEEKLPMDYAPRKIEVSGEGTRLPAMEVKLHHLDTNNHVNNGQYISMAMECVRGHYRDLPGWEEDFTVRQLRAEYQKSALLGDIIYPMLTMNENSGVVISLQDETGSTFCNVELV